MPYQNIKKKFEDIEKKLVDPKLINNPKEIAKISQEHAELKNLFNLIIELEKIKDNIQQDQKIIKEEQDNELKSMAEDELEELELKYSEIEKLIQLELKPKNPQDKKNVIMEIRAGTGGDESAMFCADLFRMYSKYSEKNNWKISILNSSPTGIGGFKEIIFEIINPKNNTNGVYANLKYEGGIHRVQRIPETEKQGRVHTSTVTVAVLPEAKEMDLEIKNEDLRIDVYSASGPGGQSVNTSNSAVRIVHLPTNTMAQCQDQKSQHQNKDKAMQILRSRLLVKFEEEKQAKLSSERKSQIGTGDRSGKIRTYNFPQDRITDHRIKKSWHSIDRIIDGELEEIIKACSEI